MDINRGDLIAVCCRMRTVVLDWSPHATCGQAFFFPSVFADVTGCPQSHGTVGAAGLGSHAQGSGPKDKVDPSGPAVVSTHLGSPCCAEAVGFNPLKQFSCYSSSPKRGTCDAHGHILVLAGHLKGKKASFLHSFNLLHYFTCINFAPLFCTSSFFSLRRVDIFSK